MTLVGLDFDNTLVKYDSLFYRLALEKGLIDAKIAKNKSIIRNYLCSIGLEERFTELQGEVYGKRIKEAEATEGMFEALLKIKEKGVQIAIISHKTRLPYKGPKYDLHQAAWEWLGDKGFFDEKMLNINRNMVFFEETKQKKIKRIENIDCSHFIDDLPEILEGLDNKIVKILYDPYRLYNSDGQYLTLNHWKEVCDIL